MIDAILNWIFRSVRIKVTDLQRFVKDCDFDDDGYVSADEFVTLLRTWVKELRK